MPRFNNRAIAGQPTRGYNDVLVNANTDVWLALTFVDRNGLAITPTSVKYQIDNLTDTVNVLAATTFGGTLSNTIEINIPASVNQMSYPDRGSQVNQISVVAAYADGSKETQVFIYTLCSVATVGGSLPG